MTTPVAFLLTFPFSVYVDTREQLEPVEVDSNCGLLRVYPPFRSAPANWVPMPEVRLRDIPFLHGCQPEHYRDSDEVLRSIAVIHEMADIEDGTAALMLCPAPEWGDEKPVVMPMDSLRVDWMADGSEDRDSEVPSWVRQLLANVRWVTQQWWIGRTTSDPTGWVRNKVETDQHGRPSDKPYAQGQQQTMVGYELPLTKQSWMTAIEASGAGKEPPVYAQLLLDAEYYRFLKDMRRMALDAATACEIAKNQLFDRLTTGLGRKNFQLPGYDVPKHVDSTLRNLCGVSYADVDPTSFKALVALWDARGRIAHGAPARYFDGTLHDLTSENSSGLLEGARKFCHWAAWFSL